MNKLSQWLLATEVAGRYLSEHEANHLYDLANESFADQFIEDIVLCLTSFCSKGTWFPFHIPAQLKVLARLQEVGPGNCEGRSSSLSRQAQVACIQANIYASVCIDLFLFQVLYRIV